MQENTIIKYESKSDPDEDLEQRDFKSAILKITADDFQTSGSKSKATHSKVSIGILEASEEIEMSPRPTQKQRQIGFCKPVQQKDDVESQDYETDSNEEADIAVPIQLKYKNDLATILERSNRVMSTSEIGRHELRASKLLDSTPKKLYPYDYGYNFNPD